MKKRYWKILAIPAAAFLFLFSRRALLIHSFDGAMLKALDPEPITTTVYATLITILLALLALAVTAYVFLTDSLKDRREPYERESIDRLQNAYTIFLFGLAILSLLALLFCFLTDNSDIAFFKTGCTPFFTIALSSIVSILLFLYICLIICHDGCLASYAHAARKKLISASPGAGPSVEIDDVFKWIGDLEMLGEQLIQNHKENLHVSNDKSALLRITSENFCGVYSKLISYRNYLWVEQKRQMDGAILIRYSEYHKVRRLVREAENDLRHCFLQGERMQGKSFTAPFLSRGTEPLCLEGAVFTNAVFEKNPNPPHLFAGEGIDFQKAALRGADFTRARLNGLNLKGAKCQEAVFTDAVLNQIQVDERSCFKRAVFQNTDFGSQKFRARRESICFKDASFAGALLTNCLFTWCDFRQAVFNQAVMSSVILDSICLSYADLSDAILTHASISFQQDEDSHFKPEKYWLPIKLSEDKTPLPAYTDRWNGRWMGPAFFVNLEKSILSQASISNYNFIGSRMSNANFTDARLEYCILDRCYGQQASFQEATLENCRFSFAMFNQVDLSHAKIINCDFSDCDLRDSLFVQAAIQGEEHQRALFHKANFTHAQIRAGVFTLCDFTDALLEDADLRNTIFERCVFKNTSFLQSDMRGVVFRNCDFVNTDFRGLDLTSFKRLNCTGYWKSAESEETAMAANPLPLLDEQAIWNRKSVRSFNRDRILDPQCLEHLLQAALRAPSPKNRQPWHFTVVTEKPAQERLAAILSQKLASLRRGRLERGAGVDDLELAQGSVRVLQDASALVFVTYIRDPRNEHGDPHSWRLSAQPFEAADLQAIGAAVENLLLTAASNGIDSLWMCDVLYAYQEYQDCLGLCDPLVACVALGYQTSHQTPREPLEAKVDYWNG